MPGQPLTPAAVSPAAAPGEEATHPPETLPEALSIALPVPAQKTDRTGKLIYLMGPSGAGKDSLIDKALEANLPGLWIAPRLITRRNPEKTTDIYLEREGFAELEARGRLALSWASHGHLYGILDSLETALDKGLTVIVNGSRDYLSHARLRYPNLVPVLVTAHPNVLKARLEKRAREDPESIAERLSRTNDSFALPLAETITIDNSESLETASEAFITLLKGYLPN